MKAKDVILNGFQTQETFDASTSSTANFAVETANVHTKFAFTSVPHGNFKAPNAHSYNSLYTTVYTGSTKNTTKNSGQFDGSYTSAYGPSGTFPLGRDNLASLKPDPDIVYNIALSKLYEQLRGSIDLSIDLLQAKQTTDMIKSLNKEKLIELSNFFLTKRIPAKGYLGTKGTWRESFIIPANAWLEFKYGWMPLLADVYDSVDQVGKLAIWKASKLSQRHTEKYQESGTVLSDFKLGLFDNVVCKGIVSTTIEVQVKTNIDPQSIANFTSLNPVSMAWEILPYSFVIDWFINVGDYLRTIETALLYSNQIENCYSSNLDAVDCFITQKGTSSTTFETKEWDMQATHKSIVFNRSIGLPLPKPPKFRASLGASRLTSAAALLAQFLRK